jgi:hypothetical protein
VKTLNQQKQLKEMLGQPEGERGGEGKYIVREKDGEREREREREREECQNVY